MSETLNLLAHIATQAGSLVSRIYRSGFQQRTKLDGSWVTDADLKAHELIVRRLKSLDTSIPVLSEESAPMDYAERRSWNRFWLVDPLDGTRSLIDGNGEFTVNVALIHGERPIMGVVGVPMLNRIYVGDCEKGEAWRIDGTIKTPISVRAVVSEQLSVCVSRSHFNSREQELLEFLKTRHPNFTCLRIGSSLKICLIAEGKSDLYPKLGPTSEWDTGAADAVLTAAGGEILDVDGRQLRYNSRDSLLNPRFLAIGDSEYPWLEELPQCITASS